MPSAAVPHRPGGTEPDLRARLLDDLPTLVATSVEHLTTEVASYQHLVRDQIDDEITSVARRNLELFVRLMRDRRTPTCEDLEALLVSATRRAEEGIPLGEVLAAYYAGARACWQHVAAVAGPDEAGEVADVGSELLLYLQVVTAAITEVYVETTSAIHGRQHDARRRLLHAVVHGTSTDGQWEDAGLPPWATCTVLALRCRPPQYDHEVTVEVESRRRNRAVRESLASRFGGAVLESLGPAGGLVLLQEPVDAGAVRAALDPVLCGRWVAGLAHARSLALVPQAARAAGDTAEVAERLGRPTGVHELPTLRLEVQLTRPGAAREELLDILAPLEEAPELLKTLAVFLAGGGRRSDAAARLHLHPNTLDYRLRQVRETTGLDPVRRDDAVTLSASLIVRHYVTGRDPAGGRSGRTAR